MLFSVGRRGISMLSITLQLKPQYLKAPYYKWYSSFRTAVKQPGNSLYTVDMYPNLEEAGAKNKTVSDLANIATGGCPGFSTCFRKKVASKRPRGVDFFLFWASADPIETYYYKA